MSMPSGVIPFHIPKPSEEGIPIAIQYIVTITVVLRLFHLNLSIRIDTIVSIKEMELVSAAKNTRIKKAPPMICPPVMVSNTFGSVMNISPGPAPIADSSPPENTYTAGMIIIPARKATRVSKNSICLTEDSRLSVFFI